MGNVGNSELAESFPYFPYFQCLRNDGGGGEVLFCLGLYAPPLPLSRKAAKSNSFALAHGQALQALRPCFFFAGYIKNLHCLIFFDILKLVNQF